MGIGTGLAVYFLIWWLMIFITLPFRSKSQIEAGHVTEGTEAAAPADPQIARRMIWNSLLSLIVFFLFWLVFYHFDYSVNDLPQIIDVEKINGAKKD